ncbi:sulfotransferase domain-containing protein, partial [Mesorhizobium sp. M7D.F.Ca.US.004.03.1.1]
PSERSIDGASSREGVLENNYYPSPAMHLEAADALEQVCRKYTGRYKPERSDLTKQRFVVIAGERTGTNLLIGLLKDYEDCQCGFELFNPVNINKDVIPWDNISVEEVPALLELRRTDPVSFWNALCERSEAEGYSATGFKLLYGHGLSQDRVLQALMSDENVMIIHLLRRNLLKRLVSEQQAQSSGKWAEGWSSPITKREPVALTEGEIINSIQQIEEHQAFFEKAFAHHRVLKIFYEDLANRPVRIAERTAHFLGLRARNSPARVKFRKTGAEKLKDALVDADALRARMRRWVSFFDR